MATPGVNVTTALRAGPASAQAPVAAQAFLAVPGGLNPIGSIVTVGSVSQFDAAYRSAAVSIGDGYYGQFLSLVRTFFEEGGQTMHTKRYAGPTPTTAVLSIPDATPVPSLTIAAVTAGAWANYVKVALAAGTTGGTKKVTLSADGNPAAPLGLSTPIVLDNIAGTTAAALATAINADARLAAYIHATAVTGTPANLAATHLAGGDDDLGNVPQSDPAIEATFPVELGAGAVIIGATLDADNPPMQTIAALAAGQRIGLVSATNLSDVDVPALRAAVIDVAGSKAAGDAALSYLGVVLGRVLVPLGDGTSTKVAVSATGYVAGVRARTITNIGAHQAPAGQVAAARYVTAPTLDGVTAAVLGDEWVTAAYAAGVNPLRTVAGNVRLYGWSSLASPDSGWSPLSARDVLNTIADEADRRTEPLVFRPIDGKGQLFAELAGILEGIALEAKAAGAIFPLTDPTTGDEIDNGYSIDVGPNVNTPQTIADGQINGILAVRVSPTAATVNIIVTKVAVNAAL